MAPKHKPSTATKAVGKCKATAGEKIEMKRCGLTLEELRSSGNRADALNVDRAIARAVKKERKRCAALALDCHMSQSDRWDLYEKIRDVVTL